MVIREFYKTRADGVKLFRTYSSIGLMIEQAETGSKYSVAIDVENASYTYTEITAQAESILAEDALSIITGGAI